MPELPAFQKIRSVEAKSGYRLMLTWENGRQSAVDLSDMISRGGVFDALSSDERFGAVRVGESGRVIGWPEPKDDLGVPLIEIDSSALAQKALEQEDALAVPPHRPSAMRATGFAD